ncbi:nucleotidyl cyclase domain-containing protein [Anaeromyxobacter paludicola]|uniref:Uncharacterized protein n=1 Tax=Anaeromyxobacter paludicola TaxID=2918171 RepID=A0ABN6N8K1_9BACT|nr:hypothetical protein [Anaeromyxobacter paludicola]BDG09381.1 hypothetical protein AMPC_24940 [Anaeromyxobacter paludicola]
MAAALAERRITLYSAARRAPADLVRLDPGALRFSLGTSLGDLRIPVLVAPDARDIVQAAAVQLALLLSTQHRHFVPPEDRDRLLLHPMQATLPTAAPTLGPSGGGPDLRAAAQLAPALHPALTGGVVTAWMGPGGRGRSLTALFIEALRLAFAEMAGTRDREPTPALVALALFEELRGAEERIRDALPAGFGERQLRVATLCGLWVAAQTGVARVLREARRPDDDPLRAALDAILSPGALLGGRVPVAIGGATLYGCELPSNLPLVDELSQALGGGGDPDEATALAARGLAADDDLSRRAEQAVAVARLREALTAGVVSAERFGYGERVAELRDLLTAPLRLAAAAAEEGPRRNLVRLVEACAAPGGEPGQLLGRGARQLRDWKAREPAASAGLGREEARAAFARAAVALFADAALERFLAPARRALSHRTGAEAEGGAEREWEAGRLYRISVKGPILRDVVERPLGHLFADVKDFTRKTGLLGQAAMADFLRREFYLPVLIAAKRHYTGMQHLSDRGGVSVNNLLGDAISFSGNILALTELALDIRRQLASYSAQLAAAVRSARIAPEVAQIEALEAGVFLSFGPPPLVVTIEDEVFGTSRVAIAEKINESARGTARSSAARARADALLAAERASQGSPGLQHAWSVFVAPPAAIDLPPADEARAVELLRGGDLAGAMRAVAEPVRDALVTAARGERPGDIYNAGAAMSEEALEAFLEALGDERVVRRVALAAGDVPAALAARYWYGELPQRLVATFHPGGQLAELFRYAGRCAFKGLAPVAVWEICAPLGAPAELARALAARWYAGDR